MSSRNFRWAAMLALLMLALSACGDSGQTGSDGDADGPIGIDICDECKRDEVCIGLPALAEDPFCARICDNELDCPNAGDCCMALEPGQDAQRYCLPSLYCNCPDCCIVCSRDSECRGAGYTRCDHETSCCTNEAASDGDTSDGDKPDGDIDGDNDDDEERELVSCDDFGPYLTFKPECDFGAVQFGDRGVCTATITNEGPAKAACIQYKIGQSEPQEFRLAAESELREGDSICIPVGGSLDIVIEYQSLDTSIPDFASLEIFLAKETTDGSIIPCTEYMDLVTQVKGTANIQTDPEPPTPIDFGQVRVGGEKLMPLAVTNFQIDQAANRPLLLTQIRLDNAASWHFSIDTEIPPGGIAIAQGATTQIDLKSHPHAEGLLTNAIVFNTNDERPDKGTISVDLIAEGVVPKVCARPFPVIFGDVPLGSAAYREVEICNCGGYELQVTDVLIDSDEALSFELNMIGVNLPQYLPPENEAISGSDCFVVELGCRPAQRGNLQSSLRIASDSSGSPLYDVPLSCNGVGPTICSFPASPIDFGAVQYDEHNPPSVPPKDIQIWNCGPGQATVNNVSIRMGGSATPAGSFMLDNFQPAQPSPDVPFILTGGDNPNTLTLALNYIPPGHGEHRAIITVDADSQGYELDTFLEVRATATDCEENWWDLNPEIPGCEYYCVFQGPIDNPDMDFIDSNCDGVDGMVDQAIFVSHRDGNDANPGTWDSPKKTLNAAIFAAAVQGKPHVYASADTYQGRLNLQSGISIYGGYSRFPVEANSPRGWRRSVDNVVTINGDHIGMNASLISAPTTVQLLTVNAYGVSQDDLSNYGIYSYLASALVLDHVTVNVGHARSGQAGFTPGQNGASGERGENGQSGRRDDGSWYCGARQGRPGIGLGGVSPCGMRGGSGGYSCKTGSSSGCAGSPGGDGIGGAPGGVGHRAGSGRTGGTGASGTDGSHGEGGTWVGSIRNGRWYPNSGQAGSPGLSGGGGGGGGGGGSVGGGWFTCDHWGGTGGGGGGGGCGGGGGAGGEGGGSSFGIFLYNSSPELYNMTVTTGDGGDGGAGRPGGRGGSGGRAGEGGLDYGSGFPGGYGGPGGNGGRGGNGGGGAGGSSIGLYVGGASLPYYEDLNFTLGSKGYGGGTGETKGDDGHVLETYP